MQVARELVSAAVIHLETDDITAAETRGSCLLQFRMFMDIMDKDKVRQMESVMQTSIEKTRDVRPRPQQDALRMPNRCPIPAVAAGIPAPTIGQFRRHDDEED